MSSIKLEIVAFPGLGRPIGANSAHARYHVGDPQGYIVFPVPRRPTCCRSASTISKRSRERTSAKPREFSCSISAASGSSKPAQRNAILRTFLETREHLSIDELHRLVKKTDPRIGFTTVYRTLKLLAGCGLASEVAFHDGIARYEHQYNRRSHHHMVCTECGASVEFFSEKVGEIEQEIGRKHHYMTTRHTFQIYGVCEECRKKRNGRRLV